MKLPDNPLTRSMREELAKFDAEEGDVCEHFYFGLSAGIAASMLLRQQGHSDLDILSWGDAIGDSLVEAGASPRKTHR